MRFRFSGTEDFSPKSESDLISLCDYPPILSIFRGGGI